MEKAKIDQCVRYAREINEEKKMCEEQIVLLWTMLSNENKASFEKCFYCQAYVNKVHETCITPAIEEIIDNWICEYYENDATESISLYEFIFSKINKVVLNNE